MNALLLRRLALTVAPVALLAGVVLLAIFGDHGLVRRHELRRSQVEIESRIEDLRAQNAELRRQIRLLDTHPLALERMASEELLMARPEATVYRFVGDEG